LENLNFISCIILDELDSLRSHRAHEEILFTLFSLPQYGHFGLIGISNELDLTNRALANFPRSMIVPEELVFRAYAASELEAIVKSKFGTQLDLAASRLVSIKVSGMSSDVRKLVAICQNAIQLAKSRNPNSEGPVVARPPDIIRATAAVNRGGGVGTSSAMVKVRSLNLIAKLVLVAFVRLLKPNRPLKALASSGERQEVGVVLCPEKSISVIPKKNPITRRTLLASYEFLTQTAQGADLVPRISETEFLEVLTRLEALGLIDARLAGRLKQNQSSEIVLGVPIEDLVQGLTTSAFTENEGQTGASHVQLIASLLENQPPLAQFV
jgi:cell division control protein 6